MIKFNVKFWDQDLSTVEYYEAKGNPANTSVIQERTIAVWVTPLRLTDKYMQKNFCDPKNGARRVQVLLMQKRSPF
jgi:hypothetical protein